MSLRKLILISALSFSSITQAYDMDQTVSLEGFEMSSFCTNTIGGLVKRSSIEDQYHCSKNTSNILPYDRNRTSRWLSVDHRAMGFTKDKVSYIYKSYFLSDYQGIRQSDRKMFTDISAKAIQVFFGKHYSNTLLKQEVQGTDKKQIRFMYIDAKQGYKVALWIRTKDLARGLQVNLGIMVMHLGDEINTNDQYSVYHPVRYTHTHTLDKAEFTHWDDAAIHNPTNRNDLGLYYESPSAAEPTTKTDNKAFTRGILDYITN